MRQIYLFFAAACCAFTFLLPQTAAAVSYKVCQDGVYYITEDGGKTGHVSWQYSEFASNNNLNYASLSGDVNIASYVPEIGEITTIGYNAFRTSGDGNMINVILPSTIKTIEYRAFFQAEKLYSIQLNEGLESMGEYVFYDCKSLTSVYFPSTLKVIPGAAFLLCTSLPAVALSGGQEHIGDRAFMQCKTLQSVKGRGGLNRNNNIKTIGISAFNGCTSLSDMHFSSQLTSIGSYAFKDCTKLENIELPSSLFTIGEFAFANSGLKTLTVNWTTPPSIQANVFDGINLGLCTLYVPKGTKKAYQNAEVWKKFGQILEPGEEPAEPITTGEKKIGNFYYDLHEDLTATILRHDDYKNLSGAIVVPAMVNYGGYTYTVNKMENGLFYECSQLTEVTLPNTITEIASRAFYKCSSLTKVKLPSALTIIGQYTFAYCTALQTISLPATVTEMGNCVFYGCSSLTSVSVPSGVKEILSSCFENCSNLTSVTLPEGLTNISNNVFAGCTALRTITLPASLTNVGQHLFKRSTNMESICSLNETPPSAQPTTFAEMPVSTCILYVPKGCKDAYKSATGWEKISNIREQGVNERIKYGKLYYQLSEDGTAYVTYETQDANNYKDLSGEITVESKINYKGLNYKVNSVGKHALRNCKGITKVNLPLNMDYILDSAFHNCSALEQINLPKTMIILYSTAFKDTKLFNDNVDADGAVYYDGCMLWGPDKSYEGDYVVKGGTRLVATHVFDSRDKISTLTFPEGLQCLCMSAVVSLLSMKTINLPSTLYYIDEAFCSFCKQLTAIYNYSESPVKLSTAFSLVNKKNCTLYVPKGCKTAYEEADVWGGFPIVEMTGIYNVTFVDFDGFVLKTEKVAEGENAHAPVAPEVEGYDFIGWDVDFTNVQSDLTVRALYERQQFTVRFLDGFNNNALIDEQQVEWALSAEAPEPPVHEGYHFTGWDMEFDIVMNDLDVIALYEEDTEEQGLHQTSQEPIANSQKLIKNGHLFIRRGNKTFNATGAEVKKPF